MRFDRLDLNLLVALDSLLETRSVSESARRLHLSQPAITGALNRLRAFFSDELLVQSGRQMLLTPKSEELANPVSQSLMLIRAEITRPGKFEPETAKRRFTIAASDYAYTIILADLIADAAIDAPGVSFEILPPGSDAGDRMERSEIDLFITVEPYSFSRHPRMQLWLDQEVIISWAGADYDQIDEEAFFAAGHAVALFGTDRRRSLADEHIMQLGRERRIDVLLPNFSALPQAVIGNRRLATMHRLYAEHLARLYPIRLHDFWKPLPDIVEIAQWHSVRDKDPGVRWLLSSLQTRTERLRRSTDAPLLLHQG